MLDGQYIRAGHGCTHGHTSIASWHRRDAFPSRVMGGIVPAGQERVFRSRFVVADPLQEFVMSFRPVGWCFCVCVAVGMSLTNPCRAATPQDIDKAIKKGVDWLYGAQNEDGNWDFVLKPDANGKWPADVKQACGPTAMAVYALLTAGENPKDPRIVKA